MWATVTHKLSLNPVSWTTSILSCHKRMLPAKQLHRFSHWLCRAVKLYDYAKMVLKTDENWKKNLWIVTRSTGLECNTPEITIDIIKRVKMKEKLFGLSGGFMAKKHFMKDKNNELVRFQKIDQILLLKRSYYWIFCTYSSYFEQISASSSQWGHLHTHSGMKVLGHCVAHYTVRN